MTVIPAYAGMTEHDGFPRGGNLLRVEGDAVGDADEALKRGERVPRNGEDRLLLRGDVEQMAMQVRGGRGYCRSG